MTRLASTLLLCLNLSGCAVGIVTSNLENIRPEGQDETFLRSLDYVVLGDNPIETSSWMEALENFTSGEHIWNGCFARNRPLVCIDSRQVRSWQDLKDGAAAWFILSFLSFAVIPGDGIDSFEATFELHVPEKAPVYTKYEYDRHSISWLPLVIVPDFWILITAGAYRETGWRKEEKRRLLLRFAREAQRDLAPARPE